MHFLMHIENKVTKCLHNSLPSHIFDKMHIMKELSDTTIIIFGIVGIIIFVLIIAWNIRQAEHKYKSLYEDLLNFKYYASNCVVGSFQKDAITQRLKLEADRYGKMDNKYRTLVNEIRIIYVKRFTQFLVNELENKNNNI